MSKHAKAPKAPKFKIGKASKAFKQKYGKMTNHQFAQAWAKDNPYQVAPSQNGIASVNGTNYVLGNQEAVKNKGLVDPAKVNAPAQEFQNRMETVYPFAPPPSYKNENGTINGKVYGDWTDTGALNKDYYDSLGKTYGNIPGYKPLWTPELEAAIATKDPATISKAHYAAMGSLPNIPKSGNGFLDFVAPMALGLVPGAGPYLAAAYGGVTNGLKGGPLAGLVGAAAGYGAGQTFGNVNAAGGLGNFVGDKIASASNMISNPLSAAASTGSTFNPFQSAVSAIGSVPQNVVANKKRAGGMIKGLAKYGSKS